MLLKFLVVTVALVPFASCARADRAPLTPLTDQEFWQLSESLSEPGGTFDHADNLTSNEALFPHIASRLRPQGGVYVGVGPEQNFSYIARVRPAVAFIVDIREDNRSLHFMYKALFEISQDRADFLSRLFSRERPAGVDDSTSVQEMFKAFQPLASSVLLRDQTIERVRRHFAQRFPLPPGTEQAMASALSAFHADGPGIRYGRSLPAGEARPPYQTLMTATDVRGIARSYLATEEAFAFVKGLHAHNLIVPVVGDFAGPHAIRRVGDYARRRNFVVSAFYGSNVEVYLTRDQARTFCGSLSALPYRETTSFIGSQRLQTLSSKIEACVRIAPSLQWP